MVGALVAVLTLIVAALLAWPLPDAPRPGMSADFLIRGVDVVDVKGGRVVPAQDVVVRGGRIASVSNTRASTGSGRLTVVDGRGRYLLPGLWDMHVHSLKASPRYTHPLSIANGVTGVREMWGCAGIADPFVACGQDIKEWSAGVRDGRHLAPRYIQRSSFAVNGPRGVPVDSPGFFRARDAGEARALVAHHDASGVDLIKTYTDLSPEAYRALAMEARRRGVAFAGHLPVRVTLEEALAAGQRSIEHPRVFLLECHDGAAELRALADAARSITPRVRARMVDGRDAARCERAMAAMAASATWWTPTLQVLRMSARARDPVFREDSRLRYVPWVLRLGLWGPDADGAAREAAELPHRDVYAEQYALALDDVRRAHAAGVRLLAGTDAGDTYVFPGFGIHDELGELVRAGLSPADALRTATINAATFSGRADDFGSIEVGKVADLLLLAGDPLADIGNTRRITGLFFNGRYLDRPALDALLAFAERQAANPAANVQLLGAALRSPVLQAQFAD